MEILIEILAITLIPITVAIISISIKIMQMNDLLKELIERAEIIPIRITGNHNSDDSAIFCIHYSKKELEKPHK